MTSVSAPNELRRFGIFSKKSPNCTFVQYPNTHDYEQLEAMYDHVDGYDSYDTGSISSGGGGDEDGGCNAPPGKDCNKGQDANSGSAGDVGWGMSIGRRGQIEKFVRTQPDGSQVITFVTWAVGY